jgi:hypothetical protein
MKPLSIIAIKQSSNIMKKTLLTAFSTLTLLLTATAQSTTFPSTDSTGANVYYRIVNAAPEYSRICLTDNTAKAGTTGFNFILTDIDMNSLKQQWSLIAKANDTTGSYYFRNRSSKKYISPEGDMHDNICAAAVSSSRININPLQIVNVGENQVAIIQSDNNDTRYFYAADSTGKKPVFDSHNLVNSAWAWKVYNANDQAVSIKQILKDANVKIEVVNRRIKVYGAKVYSIYNDDGIRMPADSELLPGIYFVNAKGVSFKTLVK